MRGRTVAALTFKHPRKQKWIWREPAFRRLERGNSESGHNGVERGRVRMLGG
jgi:hypothetical protein